MQHLITNRTARIRGYAIALLMMAIPVVGILLTVIMNKALSHKALSQIEQQQGRLFYMSEYALNYAYKAYADNLYGAFTHSRPNGGTETTNSGTTSTLLFTGPLAAERTFTKVGGWYEWQWDEADPETSLTSSGLSEKLRFKIVQVTVDSSPVGWEIVAEAQLGTMVRTHTLSGELQNLNDYTIFAAGDREYYNAPMDISGKQHFNGNVYHCGKTDFEGDYILEAANISVGRRPMPGTWENPPTESAGEFVAFPSANIDSVLPPSTNVDWTNGLDSFSEDPGQKANWVDFMISLTNPTQVVRDKNLGAPIVDPPSYETTGLGGFYALKAQAEGTYINDDAVAAAALLPPEERWVEELTFFHAGEQRNTTYLVVDIKKMTTAGTFNSLIYSEQPVILTGAAVIPNHMNFVSRGNIIVAGDFNLGAYDGLDTTKQVSAGVHSGGHNWFVTESFVERTKADPFYKYTNKNSVYNPKPVGQQFNKDADGNPLPTEDLTLDFYGSAVESIPFISGYFEPGHASGNYAVTPPSQEPIGQGRREHLEDINAFTFNKFGSDIALQNGEMVPFQASGYEGDSIDDGIIWVRSHPMKHPHQRNFGHQQPVVENIPFAPRGAVRMMWRAR